MKVVKWAMFIAIGIIIQTVLTAYYVGTKLTYKFSGFNELLSSISRGEPVKGIVRVLNPTIFNMRLKNLQIYVKDKAGVEVLSFLPVNAVFRSGENELPLTFDKGNIVGLIGDYISGTYKDYTVTVKGRLGGYLPFKYSYKLNTIED